MIINKNVKIAFVVFGVIFCIYYFFNNKDYFLPKPPAKERIGTISLSPEDTEILFELGAQDVVGVCDTCNYPQKTALVKKMGSSASPDMAAVLGANPQKVFINADASEETLAALREHNIKIITIPTPHNIEDIFFNINFVAANIDKNSADLIKELKSIADAKKPAEAKVFVAAGDNFLTVGYPNFINDILRYAGLQNIFGNVGEEFFNTSWQAVLAQNPDIIISLSPATINYGALPGAENVNAVKNRRVYKLSDPYLLSLPTPRAIRNISKLKELAAEVNQKPSSM